MVTKQRVIMHHAKHSFIAGWEAFEERLGEPGDFRTYMLERRDFADMGSPEVITVTIEPGDKLNDES